MVDVTTSVMLVGVEGADRMGVSTGAGTGTTAVVVVVVGGEGVGLERWVRS